MNIINLKDTSKLYFVGGIVRDELLGKTSFDIDIVYEGDAIKHCSEFGEVIRTNPDFGTVKVKINGQEIDFASTRTEIYPQKGHLPVVDKIGCSLKEDVMRRDFTINSLYKSLSTGKVIDFTGGLDDLKQKKLRVLHDKSFIDDPTRILRALKFSHRFGFELEEKTHKLQCEYLKNINYDMCYKRIKKELIETLGLNSDELFHKFVESKIYKLVTPNSVQIPPISIANLISLYAPKSENIWLIYAGILKDLSRIELTKKEQQILDDFRVLEGLSFHNDFEIYKNFEGKEIESIILYAVLKDKKIAYHYLNKLQKIRIKTTGKILKAEGIKPSQKYKEIFDFLLKQKLKNPLLTLEDEIELVKDFIQQH